MKLVKISVSGIKSIYMVYFSAIVDKAIIWNNKGWTEYAEVVITMREANYHESDAIKVYTLKCNAGIYIILL